MKKLHLIFFLFILFVQFIQPLSANLYPPQKAAYGQLLTGQDYPIAKMQFTYNNNSSLVEEEVTGASSISFSNGMALLQAFGVGSAKISNNIRTYAGTGYGVSCVFAAIYGNGDAGTSQIAGVGNETDGFFFACNDSIFGILYRNNSIDTIIPQANWNVDPMDGTGPSQMTLNFTDGNIFKIQYQQLEFGTIKFFIESSFTGYPVLVHQINNVNINTTPILSNLGLQLMAEVTSVAGSATLSISSMGLFIEGEVSPYLGIRNSVSGNKNVNNIANNVVTIQNDLIFSSKTNQIMVIPDQLSLFSAVGNSADAIFSLYLNPTVDNPSFSNVSSNSVVSYDTNGTTLSGGILLGTFYLSAGSSLAVDMGEYDIKLSPGNTLTVACASASSNIIVYASLSWLEQF